jgi:hypothetical protein
LILSHWTARKTDQPWVTGNTSITAFNLRISGFYGSVADKPGTEYVGVNRAQSAARSEPASVTEPIARTEMIDPAVEVRPLYTPGAGWSCDVQTSNTISLSFGPNAAWYERPGGLPAPAFFNDLMHSSYCAADIAAGEK